jgi:hypothetical protein
MNGNNIKNIQRRGPKIRHVKRFQRWTGYAKGAVLWDQNPSWGTNTRSVTTEVPWLSLMPAGSNPYLHALMPPLPRYDYNPACMLLALPTPLFFTWVATATAIWACRKFWRLFIHEHAEGSEHSPFWGSEMSPSSDIKKTRRKKTITILVFIHRPVLF